MAKTATPKKKKNRAQLKIAGLLSGTTKQKILRLEQLLTQPNVSPESIRKLRNSIRADKGKA